jgi:transposase
MGAVKFIARDKQIRIIEAYIAQGKQHPEIAIKEGSNATTISEYISRYYGWGRFKQKQSLTFRPTWETTEQD